jgi:general secretion pathway protein F
MPNFRYRAMTASGTVVKGLLEAPSETALVQQLRSEGHYPISAVPADRANAFESISQLLKFEKRPSVRPLAVATQELSALLGAGISLDRALGVLADLREVGSLGTTFSKVRARVRDGGSFADALSDDPGIPKFYVSMVRAGEMGGALETALKRAADYLARSLQVRDAIVSALVYPIILLFSAGVSIVVILTVVLPQFEPLFAEAGRSLPLPTRIVMGIGDLFRDWWWLLLLAALAGWIWLRHSLSNPAFRQKFDTVLLRIPMLGPLFAEIEIERFSRTLGTLLANGVALPNALGLSRDVLWNKQIASVVASAATSLREGESLASQLSRSDLFPAVALDLIQIGEETGKLDEMLLRQADLDEQRIRHKVDRLIALLVPAMTIILGLIVAGLIASILVAILSVNDLALS